MAAKSSMEAGDVKRKRRRENRGRGSKTQITGQD